MSVAYVAIVVVDRWRTSHASQHLSAIARYHCSAAAAEAVAMATFRAVGDWSIGVKTSSSDAIIIGYTCNLHVYRPYRLS